MPTQVFDNPKGIYMYRLLTLKAALKLELLGLRHSWRAVAPIVRRELGSKTRNKKALLEELVAHIENQNTQDA